MVRIILITGFGPFSTYKRNPSGEIAELLDGTYFKGEEVRGLKLEVKHSEIRAKYLKEIERDYSLIINTGLAPGARSVNVEKVALNWQSDTRDEEGISPSPGRIVEEGPDAIFSRINVEETVHSLRSAGIPSEISYFAGTFLCNKIFFHTLYFTKSAAGFIHFPLTPEASVDGKFPTMEIEHMIKAVETAILKNL
ncbi:MAG: pyroglutamyl-peptidase I [Thermoplasmata archaeon]